MHLRYQLRDLRDRLDLGDRPEHLHLPREHRILELRLDVGYQNQHRLDEVHHLDEGHRLCEEHHPDLDEHRAHRLHRLDVEHQLDEGRGPCPGLS
jgi:hypothetical protein